MQRNYNRLKRVATVLAFFVSIFIYSQEDDSFTDVIIDGKPAKLSMSTGEYKFVEGKVEKVKTETTSISPKTKIQSTVNKNNKLHIVQEGETFYAISKHYGISIAHIKELNGIKTNTLRIGQNLKIGYVNRSTKTESNFWIVKKGETLYSIAKANGITVSELKTLNNLETNIIKVGEQLILR